MSYVDVLNLAEYGTSAIFKGIKAGDRVSFYDRYGVRRTAKANALLLFPTHVVVNYSNFGHVVDDRNYIQHREKK